MSAAPDERELVEAAAARRFFDRSAASGGGADALSREVERRMAERLDYIRLDPGRVLDAGSGSAGVSALRRRYPRAAVVALDCAHAALAQALANRPFTARVRDFFSTHAPLPVCGDFARLPFAARSFQLVWSNLALAWAADPLAAFREFSRVLDVGGLLMFSTYGPDTLKEMRAAFAAVDASPHVHRFIDMHDLGDMLVMAGFAEPVMDMELVTLTYPHVDALIRDLRLSGQVNAAMGRRRGLQGKTAWQGMRATYEAMLSDGRLPATVEVIYGHAWHSQPRVSEDGRSIIRMDLKSRPTLSARD